MLKDLVGGRNKTKRRLVFLEARPCRSIFCLFSFRGSVSIRWMGFVTPALLLPQAPAASRLYPMPRTGYSIANRVQEEHVYMRRTS